MKSAAPASHVQRAPQKPIIDDTRPFEFVLVNFGQEASGEGNCSGKHSSERFFH